ncbi:MAG: hypothetical protein HY537_09615 [Deltaproteobacteria bacterium]|nr:hypothetical protein [Deltaproteobacteria bacterium]
MKAPKIKLNSFILIISGLIISAVTVVYYIETKQVLAKKFTELEAAQRQSVIEYAVTVLQSRKHLLTVYRENIDPNNQLAKLVLLRTHKQPQGQKLLEQFKAHSHCDYVDVVHSENGKKGFRIQNIGGKLTLLSVSSLKYFKTEVGTVHLGYYLNNGIADEISSATNSKVSFVPYTEKGLHNMVILKGNDIPEVAMTLQTTFVSGVSRELRLWLFAVSAVCLFLFVAFTYWALSLVFIRSFKRIVNDINDGAAALDKGVIRETKPKSYVIQEVNALSDAFYKYSGKLSAFSEKIKSQASTAVLGMVTAQIAHDMKSDLSTLEILLDIDANNAYCDTDKKMIRRLIDKLRAVAAIAVQKIQKREKTQEVEVFSAESKTSEPLCLLIDQVVIEKSYQYKYQENLALLSPVWKDKLIFIAAAIQPLEFKRILSNLIDNSVQALSGSGHVKVGLSTQEQNVIITVVDDGPGIPEEILPKLCTRGASFGKTGGSGLGLWYAKEILTSWGGKFRIHSLEGKGTTVEIWLPIAQTPLWLLTEIQIPKGYETVIVDDDPSVHELWDNKLAALQLSPIHFETVEAFFWWHSKQPPKERLYLIDYEFSDEDLSGTQIIEQLAIQKNSVLVTGNYDRKDVRAECERLGIRILPKPLISVVPIRFEAKSAKENESA